MLHKEKLKIFIIKYLKFFLSESSIVITYIIFKIIIQLCLEKDNFLTKN